MKVPAFFEVEKPRVLICWFLPAFSGYLLGGSLILNNYYHSISGVVSVEQRLLIVLVAAAAFPLSFLLPQGLLCHAACLSFALLQKKESVRRHPFLASVLLAVLVFLFCSAFHGVAQTEFVNPVALHVIYGVTALTAGFFALLSRIRRGKMSPAPLDTEAGGAAK